MQHFSRRALLAGAVAVPATLAGSNALAFGSPADGAAPWDLTTPLLPPADTVRKMSTAAKALLEALDSGQHAAAWYRSLADAARTKWSNFPAGASPRAGVAMGELNDEQRILVHDLLRASSSTQGYHKFTGAIRADDVLYDMQHESLFGAAHYFVSIFGDPASPDWAWMFTGHHMTALFTVAGSRVGFTPMFTGAQPLRIPSGMHAGWEVLPNDAGDATDLLGSLSQAQRTTAVIGTSAPFDVVAGPGRQRSLATFQGIAASQLGDGQQRLLWRLIGEFVGNVNSDAAQAQLQLVKAHWSDTHFAWLGPSPDPNARYYFRVHGPRILIEYDVQEPLANGGGHVHAITRDPLNDYGTDWLAMHYTEGNPISGHFGPPPNGGPPNGGPPPGPPPQ
ncbi:MAG TPA: DUF3500 domain-containing protein [Candidatus Tumulicola sp.]